MNHWRLACLGMHLTQNRVIDINWKPKMSCRMCEMTRSANQTTTTDAQTKIKINVNKVRRCDIEESELGTCLSDVCSFAKFHVSWEPKREWKHRLRLECHFRKTKRKRKSYLRVYSVQFTLGLTFHIKEVKSFFEPRIFRVDFNIKETFRISLDSYVCVQWALRNPLYASSGLRCTYTYCNPTCG